MQLAKPAVFWSCSHSLPNLTFLLSRHLHKTEKYWEVRSLNCDILVAQFRYWNLHNTFFLHRRALPVLVGNNRVHIRGWMLVSYYLPGNRLAPPPGPRANGIPAQAEEEQAIWPFPAWAGTRRRSKQFWSPSRLGGDWEGGGPQWVVCGQKIIRVL